MILLDHVSHPGSLSYKDNALIDLATQGLISKQAQKSTAK